MQNPFQLRNQTAAILMKRTKLESFILIKWICADYLIIKDAPFTTSQFANVILLKFFHCFPGSFPRLRIFKIDVSISFTDLLQAVVKNDNMADCFSCSAW